MYSEILSALVGFAALAAFQIRIVKGFIFRSAHLVTNKMYASGAAFLSLIGIAVVFYLTPPVEPPIMNIAPQYLLMDVGLVIIGAFFGTFHAMRRISHLNNPLAGSSAFLFSYGVLPLLFMKLRLGSTAFMFNWSTAPLFIGMTGAVSLGALPLLIFDEGLRSGWGKNKIHGEVSLIGWQFKHISTKNVGAFVMLCAFLSMPQNILFNGFLQLYIEALMGFSVSGLLVYMVVSLLLLWGYFEPVKKGHLRERMNNVIGIVILALIFYYTRNVCYTMISHWIANVFVTIPINWRGEAND